MLLRTRDVASAAVQTKNLDILGSFRSDSILSGGLNSSQAEPAKATLAEIPNKGEAPVDYMMGRALTSQGVFARLDSLCDRNIRSILRMPSGPSGYLAKDEKTSLVHKSTMLGRLFPEIVCMPGRLGPRTLTPAIHDANPVT